MKSYLFSLVFIGLFVLPITGFSHEATELNLEHPPRWEKLGQRRVNYGLDRDEILVTAREGRFTALRLKAELAPINIHRCVVHFADGSSQTFRFQAAALRPGQVTRTLDLPGNRRIITKVVFYYDTKNRASRRGRVELWGRR